MASKRQGTSNKLRFEVFKRDGFRCQYCGLTPPQVVLQADHIVPVADDGPTEIDNLITACQECNSGKSDISLDQVPPQTDARIEEKRIRMQQLAAYNEFLMEAREVEQEQIRQLGLHWFNFGVKGKGRNKFVFGQAWSHTVKNFLRSLAYVEILDAIDIAKGKICNNDNRAWKYFCGICWSKIKNVSGGKSS